MPFCEECAKYWAPSAMNEDGTCPACGRHVGDQRVAAAPSGLKAPTTISGKSLRELAGKEGKAPWHFKVLVGLLILYLGWRVLALFGVV